MDAALTCTTEIRDGEPESGDSTLMSRFQTRAETRCASGSMSVDNVGEGAYEETHSLTYARLATADRERPSAVHHAPRLRCNTGPAACLSDIPTFGCRSDT